jgi:hypothetical protein
VRSLANEGGAAVWAPQEWEATRPAFTLTIVPAAGIVPIVIAQNFRPDRAFMWNFGVQRQLTSSDAIEVGYVGTHGSHLFRDRLINYPAPGPGDINPRRPYYSLDPQLQSIRLRDSDGNSSYNSLQVKYTKRLASGLSIIASYTWAKSLDDQNVAARSSRSGGRVEPERDHGGAYR